MDKKYMECIANLELTTYHYKILLLLNINSHTQSQLAHTLNLQRQNVNKYIKELQALNLVDIDRTEGRNIFYRPITNTKLIKNTIKGQLKIDGV